VALNYRLFVVHRLDPTQRSFVRVLHVLLLCSFVGQGVVRAEDQAPTTAQIGERDRLSDEMDNLAKRQIWTGVERKYLQLIALEMDLRAADHLTGAYSSREQGHLDAVHERLKLAASLAPTKEIIDWLWDIDHNYSRVVLVADKNGPAALVPAMMPLDPNQRKAVEHAISEIERSRRFEGLLPRGDYVFAEQAFTLEPGIGMRVDISPKMKRIEPVIVYPDNPTATGQNTEE
jgi:hypothetical protein